MTEKYTFSKSLGAGSFGSVAKVIRNNDGKHFAMKTVAIGNMREGEVSDALNECRILASLEHPRIVHFQEAFLANEGDELKLVMELCEQGDLTNIIRKHQKDTVPIPEHNIWRWLIHMAEGLAHLHSNGTKK